MEPYVGLDVSLKETFVCVVDACGEVVCENSVGTTPETIAKFIEKIAKFIEKKAPGAVRVGLESGLLSTWLWHGLRALDLPVVCLDARHAASALKMRINNAMMRRGWRRSCARGGIGRSGSRAWTAMRSARSCWLARVWLPAAVMSRTRCEVC